MTKLFKRITAMGAAILMTASVSAMCVNAVVIDKAFNMTNAYLNSVQTYSYDSDSKLTSASNLTICRKDNYTAILSCAEIRNDSDRIYSNATNFRPTADTGSFIKVTSKKDMYYEGLYARYWSYVQDEKGNNKGEIDITRKIVF